MVVKSVHGTLALPWLAEKFSPQIVIVLRHPFNVAASYVELGWQLERRLVLHDSGNIGDERLVEDGPIGKKCGQVRLTLDSGHGHGR
jgi:hypothetical protein